ncbi:DUF4249 domain-containing protein [Lacinutrix undariae]
MKIYIKLLALFTLVFLTACEDVIDVDVPTAQTRLVIEASLDWEKGTPGNAQSITLSTTTPFFDTLTETQVTTATVKVTNTNTAEEFVFANQNDGTYSTTTFVPVIDDTYQLEVVYNNEVYTATETLMSVVDISSLTQSVDGGFDDELLELNVYFNDPVGVDNYYLFSFFEDGDLFADLEDLSDKFLDGNEIHNFYEKDDDDDGDEEAFVAGDTVEIKLYGISEAYYNYMRLLIEQYYSGGNPFSSTAAQLRGNCINETDEDNYPYGYFRATEVVKTSYTFE